jgi:hypothetical protein
VTAASANTLPNVQRRAFSNKPPEATTNSFHKRTLPKHLDALSSRNGKVLFREALALGGMESFFPLSEQFVTQSEPAFCALSSLAMVLNALNHDPKKIWKGVWRWVSEESLQCETKTQVCGHSLEKVKKSGMHFDEFQSLAHCHGVTIDSFRAPMLAAEGEGAEELTNSNSKDTGIITNKDADCEICNATSTLEDFRQHVITASTSEEAKKFIIVNFSRKFLGQTGDGHFSPVGGYHSEKDLVLILDTARFKYPPFWVPLTDLWESMQVPDKASGESRGFFIVSTKAESSTCKEVDIECTYTHGSGRHHHISYESSKIEPTNVADTTTNQGTRMDSRGPPSEPQACRSVALPCGMIHMQSNEQQVTVTSAKSPLIPKVTRVSVRKSHTDRSTSGNEERSTKRSYQS